MVQHPARRAVRLLETAKVQPLHHAMNEKTQMIGIQYLVHARWYQIPLIRIVRKITRHTSLSTICPVEIKYSHRLFIPALPPSTKTTAFSCAPSEVQRQ